MIIYEARPNVTFDVFSLCIKAGSACLLKGGKDAIATNECTVAMMRRLLKENGWDENCVTLLPADHDATTEMLHATGMVDLIIPRGSEQCSSNMCVTTRGIPVIETGAGVCHTYVHTSANLDIARAVVFNAKTRRVSVCNALDTLVVDTALLSELPYICAPLADKHVDIYADDASYAVLDGLYPYLHHATAEDFGREWLDYKMSVAAVNGLREAIDFVDAHTSHHSECIIAEDKAAGEAFLREIDAACVYVNVSTAFTRRRSIRLWRGNRHFDPETACPRTYGTSRNHYLQVSDNRRRTDPQLKQRHRFCRNMRRQYPPLLRV